MLITSKESIRQHADYKNRIPMPTYIRQKFVRNYTFKDDFP